MYDSDSVITWNTSITSVAYTLKKIHFSSTIFNWFTCAYYDDKYYGFGMLLKKYTDNFVNNINIPALIQ